MAVNVKTAAMVTGIIAVAAVGAVGVYKNPEAISISLKVLDRKKVSAADIQKLIKDSSGGNAKVEKILPEAISGFTGAILDSNGQRFVAWVPKDGSAILVGALFNQRGENLTAQAMKQNQLGNTTPSPQSAAPQPPQQQQAKQAKQGIINAVEKADGILEGRAGPIIHVFMDLNCGYCRDLYRQLTPLIDAAQLRVHWIPVAVLHPTSALLAAELLQAQDGPSKLAEHEAKFDPVNGKPGLNGQSPTANTLKIIEANSQLLKVVNDGIAATPVLIFRGKNDDVIQHAGLLQQATDVLDAIKK